MYFEIINKIGDIETIAVGGRIRDIMRLRRQFGHGNWRKLKGTAFVRLANGNIRRAELHWYQAHGIGRKKMNYPAAELRSIKMNFYLINPDAEHRGILLIKRFVD